MKLDITLWNYRIFRPFFSFNYRMVDTLTGQRWSVTKSELIRYAIICEAGLSYERMPHYREDEFLAYVGQRLIGAIQARKSVMAVQFLSGDPRQCGRRIAISFLTADSPRYQNHLARSGRRFSEQEVEQIGADVNRMEAIEAALRANIAKDRLEKK